MKDLIASFPWKNGGNGIGVACSLSLVRNIADIPFPCAATMEQQRTAAHLVMAVLNSAEPEEWFGIDCNELTKQEQSLLEDCKILTLPLSANQLVVTRKKDGILLRLNHQNHLEMTVFASVQNMADAYRKLDGLDRMLEQHLRFAFHRRFGYLSADPASAGTGLTVSHLLHLPAMAVRKKTKTLLESAEALGMTVSGFFGDPVKYPGNLYWIRNCSRMGETESTLMERMTECAAHIAQEEKKSRLELLEKDFGQLMDFCSRSKAVLQSAYRIQTAEAMNALSGLRLAGEMGIYDCGGLDWNDLLLRIMPGHLGSVDLSAVRRAELRAKLLRDMIKVRDSKNPES